MKTDNRGWHKDAFICLFLVLATGSVYFQVWDHEFINFDDGQYIIRNRQVLKGLTTESMVWAFTNFYASYWYPLTWLSFMLDIEIFGLYPGGFLLSNVLFHIANSLLLFFLLKRMTGARWKSACVAALFALHPLRVESVAWATERKDVLSTFFWFLTMWAYIRYVESPELKKYLLVSVTLTLGLMTKLMLMTLPCALVLLDFWPLKRKDSITRLLLEKIPLMVPVTLLCALTIHIHKQGQLMSLEAAPIGLRISHSLVCYVKYIGKMIWPKNLVFLTLYPHSIPVMQAAAAFFLLSVLSLLIFREWKQRPYLGVGWLWYLGTLFPRSGIVPSGIGTFADRSTYVPLIGLFIIIAWGVPDLMKTWRRKKLILAVLSFLLISLLMVRTRSQVGLWRNTETLFIYSLASMPDNNILHSNLGTALAEAGRYGDAIIHYRKAMDHANLGTALTDLGRYNEAIMHLREALRINTDSKETEYYNLGRVYTKLGKTDKAIIHYTKALQENPSHLLTCYNLGNLFLRQGKVDEAIKQYAKAIVIDRDYPEAHNNLGLALIRKGNTELGLDHFLEAVRLRPGYQMAINNLKMARQE